MELKLILVKGEPKGKEIVMTAAKTVIGRDAECDVVIASPKVSRKHCRVELGKDGAALVDEGSGNGTFVNGEKVTRSKLKPGDKVSIGPLGFVVEIDGDRGAAGEGQRGDLEDFLASLEKGEGGAADDDVIQLTDDDLS